MLTEYYVWECPMKTIIKTALVSAILSVGAAPAFAQSADVSPTLLIESGPSDNPKYRRMIFVKYLSGNYVSVNYRAYNPIFNGLPHAASLNN